MTAMSWSSASTRERMWSGRRVVDLGSRSGNRAIRESLRETAPMSESDHDKQRC